MARGLAVYSTSVGRLGRKRCGPQGCCSGGWGRRREWGRACIQLLGFDWASLCGTAASERLWLLLTIYCPSALQLCTLTSVTKWLSDYQRPTPPDSLPRPQPQTAPASLKFRGPLNCEVTSLDAFILRASGLHWSIWLSTLSSFVVFFFLTHAKAVKGKFHPCYFYSVQWRCGQHVYPLCMAEIGGPKGRWPGVRHREKEKKKKKRSPDLWNSSQLHSWANQPSPGSWPPLGIVRADELMLVKSASL